MNEEAETKKIWHWCAQTSARLLAIENVLIALAAAQKDNPVFHAALVAANNSYMAGNLNQTKLDDQFIQNYQNHLAALVPANVKQLLR